MNEEILNEQTEEQQVCGSDAQENEETNTSISEQTEEPAQEPSLEQQLNETKDKYLRLAAEFDNFRRRTSKEKLEFIAVAAEDTILAFLPVVDDLERAIKVLDEDAREGIELIYQKFLKILAARGVESLDVIDKPFNEEISEAVARIPAPCNDKAGIVIDVVQKGYKMHGKIIRYAKVVVGEQ
ncbi:MAG: nucleotide exchange factor GrpE [Bacteroidales bacterium]|jgi:molecular chaperone GrpE|nr:nucleotide exchange factor GrpE [Bacteroidales bacterium]